jgi:hypothetical protein
MNKKSLHRRIHTFAKAFSKAKQNVKEPYAFKHYMSLAVHWAKSPNEEKLLSDLYEQTRKNQIIL